jgi:hypothetical protein
MDESKKSIKDLTIGSQILVRPFVEFPWRIATIQSINNDKAYVKNSEWISEQMIDVKGYGLYWKEKTSISCEKIKKKRKSKKSKIPYQKKIGKKREYKKQTFTDPVFNQRVVDALQAGKECFDDDDYGHVCAERMYSDATS